MEHEPTRPLTRLWEYAAGHRRAVMIASSFSVLNKLFDLAPPVLIGVAVDTVVLQEDSFLSQFVASPRDQLLLLAVITFAIWVFESLFEYLWGIWWRNLAQTIEHELRIDAYRNVQELDLRWFEDRSSGDVMAALNDDVNQLERFLDHGANDMLQVLTTVIAIGIMFFTIAPQVAWMSFLPIPLIIFGSIKYQRMLEPRYARVRDQAAMVNSVLANNLGGMATIKSFTAEAREVDRVSEASQGYRQANRQAIRLSSAFAPLIRIVILAGFTATLVYGGYLTLDGGLDVGAYSVLVFLTQRLLWPLTRLGETFDLYQRAMASTNRVLDVLDTRPQIIDGTITPDHLVGDIALENVSFAYDVESPVLKDLTVRVPARSTTAIVGPTGSGKSTLIKLLLRFYDTTAGSITVDGMNLADLEMGSLRAQIGLVSQDVFLFYGSVFENIAYGRPDATPAEVEQAATIAEAHDFIVNDLPHGYDTIVGERGQKLSGGQRQRISIARAVLKDPPILILDEATSSVDNETEAAIQRSLDRLIVDRTTIVIAHRLSTIRHADAIHVMAEGRLVESGTHEELVDLGGIYSVLWRVQTGDAHHLL
ncbi:MAG: ABC transporter ATP-binding protein/permease [Acidimicrobiia bacterium]|nr:ABC transporter ATP-binding protein/permease [Acidimicrobiia bacterium]